VLGRYRALTHLDLCTKDQSVRDREVFQEVLAQCAALSLQRYHSEPSNELNLHGNGIVAVGKGRLGVSWCGQASGLLLTLVL